MPDDNPWLEGEPLQVALVLRGPQPGDEIMCSSCKRPHVVWGWLGDELHIMDMTGHQKMSGGVVSLEEVMGWRPRQHS